MTVVGKRKTTGKVEKEVRNVVQSKTHRSRAINPQNNHSHARLSHWGSNSVEVLQEQQDDLDLFDNNILIYPLMITSWTKMPLIMDSMIAHSEAEGMWWIDMIGHGWDKYVYVKRSWVGENVEQSPKIS
ncbi:hypothetical protein KI387_010538 [Taxus chinensis]|uniref:Uncharacterized protein n=1 Tax=Taxus chinensis TaxID=29808 RepID=A0AA38FM01_TAXCH|nr:hypothetical protein KI387_010538 [Taxus chinensis]